MYFYWICSQFYCTPKHDKYHSWRAKASIVCIGHRQDRVILHIKVQNQGTFSSIYWIVSKIKNIAGNRKNMQNVSDIIPLSMSFFWIRCLDKILNPFHAKFWWTYQSYIEVRSKKYFSSPNHPHADRRRPCWTRGPRASRRSAPEEGQTPATRACCWPSACLAPPPTYLCALTILCARTEKEHGRTRELEKLRIKITFPNHDKSKRKLSHRFTAPRTNR